MSEVTPTGDEEVEHKRAFKHSDAFSSVYEVIQDGHDFVVRCPFIDLSELDENKWVSQFHEYEVYGVMRMEDKPGVAVQIRWHPE